MLTGLATATFPDGSTPEVIDVVRVAANLFAAGQETTVRLLGSAVQMLAEDPELQQLLRDRSRPDPELHRGDAALREPDQGRLPAVAASPTDVGGVDIPAGTTVMLLKAAANRDPRRFDDPATFDVNRANARQHISFGRGIHTCPGAPLARAEARVSIERLLDRTTDIRISESRARPAGARRYSYVPTFILRGLTRLHIEFTPTPARPDETDATVLHESARRRRRVPGPRRVLCVVPRRVRAERRRLRRGGDGRRAHTPRSRRTSRGRPVPGTRHLRRLTSLVRALTAPDV